MMATILTIEWIVRIRASDAPADQMIRSQLQMVEAAVIVVGMIISGVLGALPIVVGWDISLSVNNGNNSAIPYIAMSVSRLALKCFPDDAESMYASQQTARMIDTASEYENRVAIL